MEGEETMKELAIDVLNTSLTDMTIDDDELFSDNFPMKLVDDLFYEVEGKTIAEKGGGIDESLIGGNKSAEEPSAEEFCADAVYDCNIILTHRLEPSAPIAKKDYATVVKPYLKAVHQKLVAAGNTERAAAFKAGMPAVIKKLKGIWDDLVPYQGESQNENAMIAFLNYRENGDPYMIFFRDGLEGEKV